MKTLTISFFLVFFTAGLKAQLIINEIMPAPEGDEPEWIELYNRSENEYTLKNGTISDAKKSAGLPEITLLPGNYALITSEKQNLAQIYDIPSECRIYEASLPVFNNTNDVAVLKNSSNKILDSIYYDMDWGEKGSSLERIDPYSDALSNENLSQPQDGIKATPGRRNSVSKVLFDLSLDSLKFSKGILSISVSNRGTKLPVEAELWIFADENEDKSFSQNEKIISKNLEVDKNLITVELSIDVHKSSYINILAVINSKKDENPANDSLLKTLTFPVKQGSVVLNEIMFDVSDENAEYVELFNKSEISLNLKNWSLHDKADLNDEGFAIENDLIINSGSYLVLCWNENIYNFESIDSSKVYLNREKGITLNNSGDVIVLRDKSNSTQDSLVYDDNMHNDAVLEPKNVSLERIDVETNSNSVKNWSSCTHASGGTPGSENSISVDPPVEGNLKISDNPYVPFSSSGKKCRIMYNYDLTNAALSLQLYNRSGGIETVIKNNDHASGKGIIEWNGTNDEGHELQPGPYILIFKIRDVKTGKIFSRKKVLVIGY